MNTLDRDAAFSLHLVKNGEDDQGVVIKTTTHEFKEDAYASESVMEPELVQEMVYVEHEKLPTSKKWTRS